MRFGGLSPSQPQRRGERYWYQSLALDCRCCKYLIASAKQSDEHLLWIYTQSCSVCLHKPPKNIPCSFVYVAPTRVLSKEVLQWNLYVQHKHILKEFGKCRHTLGNFALNTSILFKKRMIDVRKNHRELITDSNRTRLSCIRFCWHN